MVNNDNIYSMSTKFYGYGKAPYDQLFTSHKVEFTQQNYISIIKYLTVMSLYIEAYRKKTSKSRKKAKSPAFIKRVLDLDRGIDYIDRLLYEEQEQVGFSKVASNELNEFAFRLTSQFVGMLKGLMKMNKNLKVTKKDLITGFQSAYRMRAQVVPNAPQRNVQPSAPGS